MNRFFYLALAFLGWFSAVGFAQEPLIGQWSLDLPNNEAGWLDLSRDESGNPAMRLMWGVGSARPVTGFEFNNDELQFSRRAREPLAPKSATPIESTVVVQAMGDELRGTVRSANGDAIAFEGKRQPAMPSAPDLSHIIFGEPIQLFDGVSLSGWRLSRPGKINGWSTKNGILVNATPKTDFSAYGEYGNLATESVFDDFQLHVEFRLPPGGGNSGIYLRGMYEVQVTHRDSSMQGIAGPGAVFGRAEPTTNQGKPAGEWEVYDITLADRHVTVVHNGVTVVNNQPIVGCTGGAMQSDVTKAGPIMLQGDHTSVEYRNLMLRPRLSNP
jgi:hypothetical protein